jgi:hypothetical protein
MYSTPAMAASMVWHRLGHSSDGLICHVVDSLQWKWVDEQLGDFGMEDRNIRLGLATDGVNPYGVKRSTLVNDEKTLYYAFYDNSRERLRNL